MSQNCDIPPYPKCLAICHLNIFYYTKVYTKQLFITDNTIHNSIQLLDALMLDT